MSTLTTITDFLTANWENIAVLVTTIAALIPTDHDQNSVAGRVKNLLGSLANVGTLIFGKKTAA